jgi:hypothetical protein
VVKDYKNKNNAVGKRNIEEEKETKIFFNLFNDLTRVTLSPFKFLTS